MATTEVSDGLATYEEGRLHLKVGKSSFSKLVSDGEFGDPVYVTARNPRLRWSAIDAYVDRVQMPQKKQAKKSN